MRKLLLGVVAGAVLLVAAAIALAETETTYEQTYTQTKPKKSTGTHFITTSIDNENTANNKQPAAAREVDLKFPKGTKIDTKAAPRCRKLKEDDPEGNVCPEKTQVGDGNAEVRLKFTEGPASEPIPADVTAYNRKKGLWLYIVPQAPGQAPVVLKPSFKGRTLITKLEPLCVLNDCATNGEAVLTKFELTTDAKSRKTGKGKHKRKRSFLRTPKKCTSKGWTFEGTFKYDPPTPEKDLSFTQDCK